MDTGIVTWQLAAQAAGLRLADVPETVQTVAKQAILDWVGVTLAGSDEPIVEALAGYVAQEGGHARCALIGRADRVPASAAAWANGTASHALDYDDVSFSIPGHASAPVLAAVLALGEEVQATGAQVLEAFVAGYETSCRVGQLVAPNHYARGFHATATVGCFGAAAGSAHLLGLDAERTARAFGIAATQAAGLKAAFGTSCKPLQVGGAARAGLVAAQLAQLGVDGPVDILDHRLGFPHTHSDDRSPSAALGPARYVADFAVAATADAPANPFHLQTNLFKYHASCYETHSGIESALSLLESGEVAPPDIVAIRIRTNPHCDDICNVSSPATALQAKFSLRHTVAMALCGKATSSPGAFTESVLDPEVLRLQELTQVVLDSSLRVPEALVRIELRDGRALERRHDSGLPSADLPAQQIKLGRKFHALAAACLRPDVIELLETRIRQIELETDVGGMMGLTRRTFSAM